MNAFKNILLFLLLAGTFFVWAEEPVKKQASGGAGPSVVHGTSSPSVVQIPASSQAPTPPPAMQAPPAYSSGIQNPQPAAVQNFPPSPMQIPQTPVQPPPLSTPPLPPAAQKALEGISDDEALAFVKKERPDQYDALMSMKTSNPEQFSHRMMFTKMLVLRDQNLLQNNPRLHEQIEGGRMNRIQIRQKADEYRKETDSDKKEDLKKQTMDLMSQEFDASITAQKHRLEEMKKRLEEQEKHIQESETNKAKIVEESFGKLITVPTPTPPGSPDAPPAAPETSEPKA